MDAKESKGLPIVGRNQSVVRRKRENGRFGAAVLARPGSWEKDKDAPGEWSPERPWALDREGS